ncbi:hypothetical protein BDF21DRAFT_427320 [Thamnidium elegans]|nr:hypothetical protein BDF21DRAFT_427320 [Thamnidium elegans]
MDLATFNITSTSGNNYMLILVDHFSRFTILRAITDKSSLTIAKELLTLWPDKVVFYTNNSRIVSKYAHCKFGNYERVWLLNLVSMYTGFIMQYIFH